MRPPRTTSRPHCSPARSSPRGRSASCLRRNSFRIIIGVVAAVRLAAPARHGRRAAQQQLHPQGRDRRGVCRRRHAGGGRRDPQRSQARADGADSARFSRLDARPCAAEQAARGEWGEVDSDWSYTVLARIGAPGSDPKAAVSATFRHSCLRKGKLGDYVAFYGSAGTVHVDRPIARVTSSLARGGGCVSRGAGRRGHAGRTAAGRAARQLAAGWEVPQRAWNALARDFVADIIGRDHTAIISPRGRLAPSGSDRRRACRRRMVDAGR